MIAYFVQQYKKQQKLIDYQSLIGLLGLRGIIFDILGIFSKAGQTS